MKQSMEEQATQSRLAQSRMVQSVTSQGGADSDAASQQVIDTRKTLRNLFDSYALIGNRMTVDTIQSQKYHRIMKEAGVYS